MGVRLFYLTNDELAKKIKNKYKDVKLILSITRCITDDDLQNSDLSMYDKIVLPFRYCRSIKLFEKLPKDKKYILLVNSHCLYNCNRCKAHWYLTANNLEEFLQKEQRFRQGGGSGIACISREAKVRRSIKRQSRSLAAQ